MNWYKLAQVNDIASAVLQLIGEANRGVSIPNPDSLRNIVSKIPDETTLNNAINTAVSFAGEMTPDKNDVISAIWAAFKTEKQNSDKTNEGMNEMVQETIGAIEDVPQVAEPAATF